MQPSPQRTYYSIRFMEGFFFMMYWTIMAVFQIKDIGFQPLQLVLMGTLYEVAIMLCEVPTGVVADLYSRKLSIILGFFVVGTAILVQGLWPIVTVVVGAQLLLGLGETFISGAREAWIADEISHGTIPHESAGSVFIRGSQTEIIGRILGALTMWPLLHVSRPFVIIVSGIGFFVLTTVAWFTMTEKGFHRSAHERSFWSDFREGWTTTRSSVILLSILAVSVLYGLASEGFDRMGQKHILNITTLPAASWFPVDTWWAVFSMTSLILAYFSQNWIRRNIDMEDGKRIGRILLTLTAALIIGVALFGIAPTAWITIGLFVVVRVIRRTIDPCMKAWINLYAPSEKRATILSFEGQAHSFGEIAGGPGIGYIGNVRSIRDAMLVSAVLLAPTLGFLQRLIRLESRPK